MASRQIQIIGLGVVGASTLVIGAMFGDFLSVLPLALGVAALVLQARAGLRSRADHAERDEMLVLLQAVVPKLRIGMPVDAAFVLAASETKSATAVAIGQHCERAGFVLPDAARDDRDGGALTMAIVSMIRSGRENGGDVATPFANLTEMIESDQRLRRRQQTATLHVRSQANGLIVIAVLVVLSILFGAGVNVDYFRDTPDGRGLLLASLTTMVWGYVIVSTLNARIGHG